MSKMIMKQEDLITKTIDDKVKGVAKILEAGKKYYEIRLESIGGLGANLCGKMLGELGVKYLDLNSISFSSYGSEKTGTPVKGHIRFCSKNEEIRVHSPVVEPDLLIIFHQALLKDESVWKGCNKNTKVIIALDKIDNKKQIVDTIVQINEGRNSQEKICNVYGVEGPQIAMETHSRINVVMLGAALKIMGLNNIEAGKKICTETLGKKYPDALRGNIEGIRRGYEETTLIFEACVKDEKSVDNCEIKKESLNEWGYDNAPLGGINPRFGNTVISDLSPSRQGYIPLFIEERCINCGLCHSTCPDMVFQFEKGEYKGREMMVNRGLDYYHCKGCLRCVDVCPVNALVRGLESEHETKEYFLTNQELLRKPDYYEKSGPDGYITSESYLTEKRMEGGEV